MAERSFYQLLGVSPGASQAELDRAYLNRRQAPVDDPGELRFAWKALRDPFYAPAYKRWASAGSLKEAGFIDDGVEPEGLGDHKADLRLLTTPLDKLDLGREASRRAVLLGTGCYAPLHPGHVSAMESARTALEAGGVAVIGGYLSPSHDDYVLTKPGAEPIGIRLAQIHQMLEASDWLMCDPWEGLYIDTAVNFTDVIARLEAYLAFHTGHKIEVHYVFGADNAAFARAFCQRGQAVCVSRGGYEKELGRIRSDPLLAGADVIWAEQDPARAGISSTQIRERETAREREARRLRSSQGPYVLRDDLDWATEDWDPPAAAVERFREEVVGLIGSQSGAGEVLVASASEQARHAASWPERLLSLDVIAPGEARLELSRVFELSSGQLFSDRLVARPGRKGISEQLEGIDRGRYLLLDDDISSGATRERVLKMLPERVEVAGSRSLLASWLAEQGLPGEVFDVADLRDFLIGSRDGGLVVRLPSGELARAPYMLPWVFTPSRARTLPLELLDTSIGLLEANVRFFSHAPGLTLADAEPSLMPLARAEGFKDGASLLDFARWHLKRLKSRPYCPALRRPSESQQRPKARRRFRV